MARMYFLICSSIFACLARAATEDSLIAGRDVQQPFLPMTNKQQETNTAAEISAIDKDESVVDKRGREEKRRKRTRPRTKSKVPEEKRRNIRRLILQFLQ